MIKFIYKPPRRVYRDGVRGVAIAIGKAVAATENRILEFGKRAFKDGSRRHTGLTGRRWIVKKATVDSIGRVRHGVVFNTTYGAYGLEYGQKPNLNFLGAVPEAGGIGRLEKWVIDVLGVEPIPKTARAKERESRRMAKAIAMTFTKKGIPTSGIPPEVFSGIWVRQVIPFAASQHIALDRKIQRLILGKDQS